MMEFRIAAPELEQILKNQEKIIQMLSKLADAPTSTRYDEDQLDHGPGYRVYFFLKKQEIIVLLCGGDKSSQYNDIEKAKLIASELEVEE